MKTYVDQYGRYAIEADIEIRNQHERIIDKKWYCESQSYSCGPIDTNDFKERWESFEKEHANLGETVVMV